MQVYTLFEPKYKYDCNIIIILNDYYDYHCVILKWIKKLSKLAEII